MSALAAAHRYAFAPSEDGAVRLDMAASQVICRPSGALYLEAESALVVADLHFEKGSSYAARGQMLPPYDTRETLTQLEREIAALAPRTLILLGDSFHDRGAEDRLAPDDAARLAALASGRTLIWVVGNHDADGPKALPGEIADELDVAGLRLRHEPADGSAPHEVSGHLHPCATVVGRGQAVRRRCFVSDGDRIILPAFGAYTGGLSVRDPAFAGLFARDPLLVLLNAGRAHAVGWRAQFR